MKNAIIIMTKVPEPGLVKTRFQPFLTPEQSAQLAVALLKDAESKVKNINANTIIAFAPVTGRNRLLSVLQPRHVLLEQKGSDLGERMNNAFGRVFESGYERIVLIGTDSPAFPRKYVEDAFEMLQGESNAVLGKAHDGGFYLIGLKKQEPGIFMNVKWGTSSVFDQTARNIDALGLKLARLPVCSDLDCKEDLLKIAQELATNPDPAPYTAKWIELNLPRAFIAEKKRGLK